MWKLNVNRELTLSVLNALTERPSPPDQSWSCLTERERQGQKRYS